MAGRIATVLLLAGSGLSLLFALVALWRGLRFRPHRRHLLLQVTARQDHGHDLFTLVLRRPWFARLQPLPSFLAGQSVALSLPGKPLRRRYSIARWQRRPDRYVLTIKREEQGKLSRLLADGVQPGARLTVQRPSGEFVLPDRAAARQAVLIAGGVGVTPLLAMVDQWHRQGGPFESVHLYWQVRWEGEWVYRDALENMARRNPRFRPRFLASRPLDGRSQRLSTNLLQQELGSLADACYFLCAGHSLLEAMVAGLAEQGVPEQNIHYERFGFAAAGSRGHWSLDVDGRTVPFRDHQSILDALEDQGISLPSDCRAGSCGECLVSVLSGQVEHFTTPELPVPSGRVLACCAVPLTDARLTLAR